MASFSEFWNGSPGTTNLTAMTPWIKAPGYDFSARLYDYMSTLVGQPSPRWGGFGKMAAIGQRKNPYLNDVTQLAGRYMNTGLPTVFGQATGTLGRFANPSFANPVARLQLGTANYFGNQALPGQYTPPQENP